MRLSGREFGKQEISLINQVITEHPGLSRRGLSLRVCQELEWRSSNGRYKEVNCRKALLELDRLGMIKLPEARSGCFQKNSSVSAEENYAFEAPVLECALSELGEIRVIPVDSCYSDGSRLWNHVLEKYHYLGKGPLCGAQIRYLIVSSKYGCIGAMSFSGSQWRLKARDQFIGWGEGARHANLNKVVCNSRFLILPTVRVPNLASHVLSLSLERLSLDWQERYAYKPVLVETFVDTSRFTGTCYQASNWIRVGETAGEGNIYPNGKKSSCPKSIYLYPLHSDWQNILCHCEVIKLGNLRSNVDVADCSWMEAEFGRVEFYDERLKARLFQLASDFHEQPAKLIPTVCGGSEAKIKAAYRFFKNENVSMQTILRPHIESTIDRAREHKVVLAVQDTTSLNYTAHPPDGAGRISTSKVAVGFELHGTMAFTPDGVPLGLLNVQCWARDEKEVGKKYKRHQLSIEEKESRKWFVSYRAVAEIQNACPGTMFVSVGDRESDIYDLFYEASQTPEGPKFLVRSERTRKRKVVTGDGTEQLWIKMTSVPIAGTLEISIPPRGSSQRRIAKLELRYANVKLKPPIASELPEIEVWAVYACETDYGEDVRNPLEWMLLTSVPTESFEQSCERLNWYARRWGIEVYHRILKSGCRIEDRRLADTKSLLSCLAIDMVVGWRVYWFTQVCRDNPDERCDQILSEDEWRVLGAWATKKK